MRARLRDIARETGYSINTVSLSLRGSPRVPEATTKEILAVAKALNYVANNAAKSLVQKRTQTVGVILTDIMNPVLTAVAQHTERKLMLHGYAMILMTTYNRTEQEIYALDVLRGHQVDGMLIYPASHGHLEHVHLLRDANYPILLLAGDKDASCDMVTVDSALGAYRATTHLIRLGHKHIALLDGGAKGRGSQKYQGYRSALAEFGVPYNPILVVDPEGLDYVHGYHAAGRLFQQQTRPSALLASMDVIAIGALRWCRENGLLVPQDVAIIGFDDTEAAEFSEVPLTSVTHASEAVSDKAVQHLLALIAHNHKNVPLSSREPVKEVIEPGLAIRESCGAKIRGFQREEAS